MTHRRCHAELRHLVAVVGGAPVKPDSPCASSGHPDARLFRSSVSRGFSYRLAPTGATAGRREPDRYDDQVSAALAAADAG